MSRLIRICAPVSSPTRREIQSLAMPAAQVTPAPMPTPAITSQRKSPKASISEKLPVSAAMTAKRMQTRPEASFSSASPCKMCISRCGIGVRAAIAATATGSVGEMTAASAKATASGMCGIMKWRNRPTPSTVNTTSPKASCKMVPRSRISPSLGMRQPSRNRSGGRNRRKKISGFSCTPRSATAAISTPSTICTSGSGTGMGSDRVSPPLATTARSRMRAVVMASMRDPMRTRRSDRAGIVQAAAGRRLRRGATTARGAHDSCRVPRPHEGKAAVEIKGED